VASGGEPVIQEAPWLPYVDFKALDERFPGIVAWIQLEGTAIDYPVMQTKNNDYFLNHLPDGTSHRSGSIFLDYRNKPGFSDKNTLIYGHDSRAQDMFGALKNYRRQTFYDEHPAISIYTNDRDYRLVLIAGYLLDSGVEVPPMEFIDEAAFQDHITDIKRRSFFKSGAEVSAGDRLVSLCTCAYDYTNARFVIVGKLVAVGGVWPGSGILSQYSSD
jgi:sortase B